MSPRRPCGDRRKRMPAPHAIASCFPPRCFAPRCDCRLAAIDLATGLQLARLFLILLQIGAEMEPPMPVNLSIKNAPDDVVRRLRERAERHHRSLQGELLAIVEEAVSPAQALTPQDVLAEIEQLGLRTPSESAAMIREDRDAG